jgi:N-methylhydantoinase A/oxoprolinase/acetone carboxylase beta subunit
MVGIGIDTGGTYTDAVIYDFETRKIKGEAKALTTMEDLKKGITRALQKLPGEELKKAGMVALSTTLATNICVENRGGKAKLIFIGVSEKTFDEVGKSYGIENREDVYFLDCVINSTIEGTTEPDWEQFACEVPEVLKGCQGVSIVQLFSKKFCGNYEKKARDIIRRHFDGPIILGKDLFSDLNAIKRGAGALLNARLIPVIHDFLGAVKKVFHGYGISVPPVIVRSDGSLMNEALAGEKPVETLLCGPAASIVGARYLSGEDNALIVDMGGTTTDIAVVEQGKTRRVNGGIHIGNWKTFVKGMFVDTFALGGDTAVHYDKSGRLFLEDYRVIPLTNLAQRYPEIAERLRLLADSGETDSFYLHEFLVLVREPEETSAHNETERRLCRALKKGPMMLKEAAQALGKDLFNLKIERLEKEGYIIRAGLTPTDAMALKGDYPAQDRGAALAAAAYMAHCTGIKSEDFADVVYSLVQKRLYCNLVRILLQVGNKSFEEKDIERQMRDLIEISFENKMNTVSGRKDTLKLGIDFSTPLTLVGVGAPAHIFLPQAAELLGTKAVIPPHAHVANAIGAVAGNVSATLECELVPVYTTAGIDSYDVFCGEEKKNFKEYEDANAYILEQGSVLAKAEALRRGAAGEPTVEIEKLREETLQMETDLFLCEKYSITATGKTYETDF